MYNFNTIPEALDELRAGRIILVTDDPERENEGDFICAAEFATTENVNFMATHGKGLICMPMSAEYVERLHFPQMVSDNTDNHETAFTVSIDHISTTTGISAAERSITAMKCVDPDARPSDFRRPGHMFPLLAKKNGVLDVFLASLTGNALGRPDFVAHDEVSGNDLPTRLTRRMGAHLVAWTVRDPARMRALRKKYELQIFEGFLPDD